MTQPTTAPVTLRPGPSPFACRLRHRQTRRGFDPVAGEIELENTSAQAAEISVQTSPLQYLDIVVTGPRGEIVSEVYYGDLFSPLAEPYTLRLEPGQKYTGPVSFLGNVPREKQLPGRYTVLAVFQYGGWKVVSEPYPFELRASDIGQG